MKYLHNLSQNTERGSLQVRPQQVGAGGVPRVHPAHAGVDARRVRAGVLHRPDRLQEHTRRLTGTYIYDILPSLGWRPSLPFGIIVQRFTNRWRWESDTSR